MNFLKKAVTEFHETLEKEKRLIVACKQFNRKKIPDLRNAKEHYESFLRKKNRKLVKNSEIITYQLKTFENLNIFDITSKNLT